MLTQPLFPSLPGRSEIFCLRSRFFLGCDPSQGLRVEFSSFSSSSCRFFFLLSKLSLLVPILGFPDRFFFSGMSSLVEPICLILPILFKGIPETANAQGGNSARRFFPPASTIFFLVPLFGILRCASGSFSPLG